MATTVADAVVAPASASRLRSITTKPSRSSTLLFAALCVLLLAAAPVGVGAQFAQFNARTYRVCVSAWAPFVFYNETTGVFSGYEIDLANEVFTRLGITAEWHNMLWGEMTDGLKLPLSDPAHCDIAPSSIPVTHAESQSGARFSIPTFRSGYAVLVPVQSEEFDLWGFAKVGVERGEAFLLQQSPEISNFS